MMRLTHHASADRIERLTYITMTIGLGEIVKEVYQERNDSYRCITSTGVCVVRSASQPDLIITAFIASNQQIKNIYQGQPVPQWLRRKVKYNYDKGHYMNAHVDC